MEQQLRYDVPEVSKKQPMSLLSRSVNITKVCPFVKPDIGTIPLNPSENFQQGR